ncbi:MAG: NAD(P)-dependent oxidoreductase [Chloroflexaceae bacterium]|nr:NAD(P)-dependent oxidoreductase [Chloroflexaceae bacterium]
MSIQVGFIGLGAIGEPMAATLRRAGFPLTICGHRNRAPLERLQAQGANVVANPAAVAAASAIVVTCLPNTPQVEAVCLGPEGIVHGAAPGTIVIDCSTIAPTESQRIAEALRQHNIEMLDAPISGGPERAATGELAIMVGGHANTFEYARPVLEALGARVTHVGPHGMGEVVKLTNNTILGSLMIAIAEAFTLAVKAGADAATARDVIMNSAGANFLLDRWIKDRMLVDNYDPGFATSLMKKDLGAALESASNLGVPMMMTALAYQLYALSEGEGYAREDYCAVSKIYQDAANITIATGQTRHSTGDTETAS